MCRAHYLLRLLYLTISFFFFSSRIYLHNPRVLGPGRQVQFVPYARNNVDMIPLICEDVIYSKPHNCLKPDITGIALLGKKRQHVCRFKYDARSKCFTRVSEAVLWWLWEIESLVLGTVFETMYYEVSLESPYWGDSAETHYVPSSWMSRLGKSSWVASLTRSTGCSYVSTWSFFSSTWYQVDALRTRSAESELLFIMTQSAYRFLRLYEVLTRSAYRISTVVWYFFPASKTISKSCCLLWHAALTVYLRL